MHQVTVQLPPLTASPTGRHAPGEELVPGYRLIEPLGKGGFGEVWKCEAPGGLFKAIKFVPGGIAHDAAGELSLAGQEFDALQRVKLLRHPFLLSLDRVEVVGNELVVVMELADLSLQALFALHQEQGEPGIPRDELLGYLLEAAEALDWINFEHGLQHLDVKPHNLFLVSNHVKVADFGLVHSHGPASETARDDGMTRRTGGVTPLYSAPEMQRGLLSRNSDQYSLAIVYQQLVSGTLPFWHEQAYELMMQHQHQPPNLAGLTPADQAVVGKALAKSPEQRYPSCLEFVQALMGRQAAAPRRSGMWRRSGVVPAVKPGSTASLSTAAVAATVRRQEPPPDRTQFHPPPREPVAAPTLPALPGYRFVTCVSQTPFADLWQAASDDGQPWRALWLQPALSYDHALLHRLQALADPRLAETVVHGSPGQRLLVLTACYAGSLRDRFEQCRRDGQPGVPRAELIHLLRGVAETLDALAARDALGHLGLHPRNLLLDGDQLRVADYGLVPLLWLPTGQTAGSLNPRYAAPELFDRKPGGRADQYSLAVMYAELLTNVHPRPHRPESGLHPRGKSGPRSKSRVVRLDLDLVPAPDRAAVARAMDLDPAARFPSCTAFLDALEQAACTSVVEERYHTLPPVIPFATLMGEAVGGSVVLPPVSQVVAALLGLETAVSPSQGPAVEAVGPDGCREYRCPVHLLAGTFPVKIEGFRAHWNAHLVAQREDACKLLIDVPVPQTFWERMRKQRQRVAVTIDLLAVGTSQRRTEGRIRISYDHADPNQRERVLATLAPQIIETFRVNFQATQEQRDKQRWPFEEVFHAYPVLPDLDVAPVQEAIGKNLSFTGISLRMAARPPSEYLYLHFPESPLASGYAVLARVVRAAEVNGGWEIGASFASLAR